MILPHLIFGNVNRYDAKTMNKKENSNLDKLGLVKIKNFFFFIKNFCVSKNNIKKVKRQPTGWEKRFASHISAKDLHQECMKTSYSQTIKRKMAQLKDRQRIWVNVSPRKIYKEPIGTCKKMLNIISHHEKASHNHSVIRLDSHKNKRQITSAAEAVENPSPYPLLTGCKCCSHCGRQSDRFSNI